MNEYNQNDNQVNNEEKGAEQGYTWQNPSPYTNAYNGYTQPPKAPKPKKERRKLKGAEIALISVGCIAFALLISTCVLLAILASSNTVTVDPKEPTSQDGGTVTTPVPQTDNVPSLETQPPTSDAMQIPQIYQKVKDSVVGVSVTYTSQGQVGEGSGTGIILSEDGYISTNAHVVSDATTIKVVLTDKTEYPAELIGLDEKTDLAVLKIDKAGLQPAEFGDSNTLNVGETVVAIGNPYGQELASTVTSGIVSALNRELVIENVYMSLIQTDASINPGNSGGPLVNVYGQVIGITSSKVVTNGYEGIGFAIPISGATDIIEELIQYGYIKDRPSIGIMGSDIDQTYAKLYDIPNGVRVEYVDPESDAYQKGLKKGDIITAVNGVKITSMATLDSEKNKNKPGDTITLTVYRNTKTLDISIVLSESSKN